MNGGEFLEPESMYSFMAWRFPIWYFFSVILSESMYISTFFVSSLFHQSAYPFGFFVMFSWLPYFTPEFFSFSCTRLFVCFHVISPNFLVEFSFIVLECSVLSLLFWWYLLNLPSFASIFWFISLNCIVIFSCVAFFPFCPNIFQRFSFVLSFWPVFVPFLSAFPVEFPIKVLIFCSCSLRESLFSHELILHWLVHLIRLCFLSVYMLIVDLFFPFSSWLFSILCSLVMTR